MPKTPDVTAVPYLTAAGLWAFVTPEIVGDALRPGQDDPRPSRLALEDTTREPGSTLNNLLLAASGELESAALVGKRYAVADLQALTGSGRQHLYRIVAGLAMWLVGGRLKPATADPGQIPGAVFAHEQLKALRDGEAVFGFVESGAAGLPEVAAPDPTRTRTPAAVVGRSDRLFGRLFDPRFGFSR